MSIKDYLNYNEKVLFEAKVPSIKIYIGAALGTYSAVMTNQNRIIVHDTGGFFGDEKVYYYPKTRNIHIEFTPDSVKLWADFNGKYEFNFKLNFIEFYTILTEFGGNNRLVLAEEQNHHCLIYTNPYNMFSAEFYTHEQEIIFKLPMKEITIDISEIKNFYDEQLGVIQLEINPDIFGVADERINIYIPNEFNRSKVINLIKNRKSIHDIAKPDERITAANLQSQLTEEQRIEYDVYILDNETSIRIVLRNNFKVLMTKEKKDFEEFYNHQTNETILKMGENYFFIKPNYSNSYIQFKNQNSFEFLYIEDAGTIKGLLDGIDISEDLINLAISRQNVNLISNGLSKCSVNTNSYKFITDDNLLIMMKNGSLASLDIKHPFDKELKNLLNINEFNGENILFARNKEPYYFEHTQEGLLLYKTNKNEPKITLQNESLSNLKLSLQRYGKSFGHVSNTNNSAENLLLYFPVVSINTLIYNTFISIQSPLLVKTDPKALYKSMVRQISDLVLYEYFGQLIALYEGIDQFSESNMSEKERSSKLVSYLYHGVQSQRKRMDSVSVHMPSVLNQVEQELFKTFDKQLGEHYFKELQMQLISITNQMKGSLLEIENSLTNCGVLIPKRTTKELISARKKTGYKTAGIGAALGVGLTIITGGAAAPMLLAPTFMAMNTKNTTKVMELQEEIKEVNEQSRTDFFLLKALDVFDHYIQTMLPFYFSKVNDSIFGCYKKIALEYTPILHEHNTSEMMFKRIAEIHTYKKLPIDLSVEVSKQELLDDIFNTVEEADFSIKEYQVGLTVNNVLKINSERSM